jgi:5-(carboxyamino)imidazole ribonucleotide mutase
LLERKNLKEIGGLNFVKNMNLKGVIMKEKILVSIIAGSDSDLETANEAVKILKFFSIPHSINIASAHRSAKHLENCISNAVENGAQIFIAAAGMSAALPGAIAAQTILPVIGVPIAGQSLAGLDCLLSISQMPKGVPVATMSIGKAGAVNAAVLAVQILALSDAALREKLAAYKKSAADEVISKDLKIQIDKTGIADG